MAKPSVSSTGSPYMDDSSEIFQSSAEPQQPIVFEFLDGGPVLSEQPFGGIVEFNWLFSNPWFGLGIGEYFPPLTLGSPFIAVVFPPSPRCLLRDLAAGSNMSESSEEIPTSGEDYPLYEKGHWRGSVPYTRANGRSPKITKNFHKSLMCNEKL